jgi:hypothetical protein
MSEQSFIRLNDRYIVDDGQLRAVSIYYTTEV